LQSFPQSLAQPYTIYYILMTHDQKKHIKKKLKSVKKEWKILFWQVTVIKNMQLGNIPVILLLGEKIIFWITGLTHSKDQMSSC